MSNLATGGHHEDRGRRLRGGSTDRGIRRGVDKICANYNRITTAAGVKPSSGTISPSELMSKSSKALPNQYYKDPF